MISGTADEVTWSKLETGQRDSKSPDVTLIELKSHKPLHAILEQIFELSSTSRSFLAVVGRSRQMVMESHRAEISQLSAGPQDQSLSGAGLLKETVGDVGAAIIVTTGHQVLVLQATRNKAELNES